MGFVGFCACHCSCVGEEVRLEVAERGTWYICVCAKDVRMASQDMSSLCLVVSYVRCCSLVMHCADW